MVERVAFRGWVLAAATSSSPCQQYVHPYPRACTCGPPTSQTATCVPKAGVGGGWEGGTPNVLRLCVPDIIAGAFVLKARQHTENEIIVGTQSAAGQTPFVTTSAHEVDL